MTERVILVTGTTGAVVHLAAVLHQFESTPDLIDERTAPQPDTEYGRTKLAAEQVVLSATSGGRRIGTVLRAAATYGPRVNGNDRRLAQTMAAFQC